MTRVPPTDPAELYEPVTWASWRGASVQHALKEETATHTLCGQAVPSERPKDWVPRIVVHLAPGSLPERCRRCTTIAGFYADQPAPASGQPSQAALSLLEEIADWRARNGHCPFHELSAQWTKEGREGLGHLLRELHELALVEDSHDDSGLVYTLVPDLERLEVLDAALAQLLAPKAAPRSRRSGLAERSRMLLGRLAPAPLTA